MRKRHVIGMFDSGVGGLTVMQEMASHFPDVEIIYFGDTARVPYGNRTVQELLRFGEEIISFLIGQGAEGIIVACNTSSAMVLNALQERFPVPMVGMIEPGSRLAVEETAGGRIGLIATEATVRSKAYASGISKALARGCVPHNVRLFKDWREGKKTIGLVGSEACPLFVPLIEAGLANSEEARGIARTYLAPLQKAGIDTLILGCTHYPFLSGVIREIMPEVKLVDPAQAVMEEVEKMLAELDRRGGTNGEKEDRYFVSGDAELFKKVGNTLLKKAITNVEQVRWEDWAVPASGWNDKSINDKSI